MCTYFKPLLHCYIKNTNFCQAASHSLRPQQMIKHMRTHNINSIMFSDSATDYQYTSYLSCHTVGTGRDPQLIWHREQIIRVVEAVFCGSSRVPHLRKNVWRNYCNQRGLLIVVEDGSYGPLNLLFYLKQNSVLALHAKFHCNCGQTVSEKFKLDNSAQEKKPKPIQNHIISNITIWTKFQKKKPQKY